MPTWFASTQYCGHVDLGSCGKSTWKQLAKATLMLRTANKDFIFSTMMSLSIEFNEVTEKLDFFVYFLSPFANRIPFKEVQNMCYIKFM